MAEVTIQTKIDAADAAQTIQELRKSLKDLVSAQGQVAAGSAEWKKLSKAINETEGRIGDLTDSFKTLQGSGVERVRASFGLLREGFSNFDFGKIKIGFQAIGSAMKAVPAFLIAEGIIKLIENFDKLKNSSGLLGEAFKAIGKIIDTLTGAIADFTDWIGITNIESEKLAQSQIDNAKKIQDAVSQRYDIEIRLAKAAGKNTEDIEKEKLKAVRQSLLEQINLKAKAALLDGELNDEELKNLDELRKALTENYVQEKELNLKSQKDQQDANKKKNEDYKKSLDEKKKADEQSRRERAEGLAKDIDEERKQQLKLKEAQDFAAKELLDQKNKQWEEEQKIKNYWQQKAADENAKIEAEVEKEAALRSQRKQQIEANYFNAVGSLAETFFQLQIESAEGNEERQNELRKKAFQVDKALKASQATIDGIKSVNATLAQGGALAVPLAISVGVLAFANVAKILAQKFDDKAGGGSTSTPRSGGVNLPNTNTPTPNTNQVQQIQQGTVIKERPIIVKVSEINDVQDRVARVEEQAVF